jgi:hypothetical protein
MIENVWEERKHKLFRILRIDSVKNPYLSVFIRRIREHPWLISYS